MVIVLTLEIHIGKISVMRRDGKNGSTRTLGSGTVPNSSISISNVRRRKARVQFRIYNQASTNLSTLSWTSVGHHACYNDHSRPTPASIKSDFPKYLRRPALMNGLSPRDNRTLQVRSSSRITPVITIIAIVVTSSLSRHISTNAKRKDIKLYKWTLEFKAPKLRR